MLFWIGNESMSILGQFLKKNYKFKLDMEFQIFLNFLNSFIVNLDYFFEYIID